LPNSVKGRRVRVALIMAHIVEVKAEYNNSVQKREGKMPLGRPMS
jgi:hypothetical protein